MRAGGNRRLPAVSIIIVIVLAAGLLPHREALSRAGVPAGKKAPAQPAAARAEEPAPAAETGGAGGETSSTQPGPERKPPRTYLDFAIAGGPVMIPIALTSVFFIAYLAERLIRTRRSRILPSPLAAALKGSGGPPPREKLEALCAAHPSAAATIIRAALERAGEPYEDLERGVNSIAQREMLALRRNMRVFAIIATVAPLLGLLGTVTGLIGAFREVSIQGLGQGQAYAAGIYEALANTAAGLIVAIPALVAYHWLMARVDGYMHQIDFLVTDFVEASRRAVRT